MPVFAVTYRYDDREDRRDQVRPAHRSFLRGLNEDGRLLASGPFAGAEPGALLLFRADGQGEVEALVEQDPFVVEGLVAERRVREWAPVFGPWA